MIKFKIYKDVIFMIIVISWLIGNMIELFITNEVIWVNIGFIIFISILILIKSHCIKFENWLNTKL